MSEKTVTEREEKASNKGELFSFREFLNGFSGQQNGL
jgi:hypothetical protein